MFPTEMARSHWRESPMANDDNKPSFFARYIDGPKEQPPVTVPRGPLLQPIVPPADSNSPPIERLLDFIVNRWPKPAIRVREICQFGPGSIRDRKSAIALTEILAQNGWLAPLPP